MSVSISTKQGSPSPPGKVSCADLDKKNKDARKKFIQDSEKKRKKGLSKEEKTTLRKAKRGGMTYSSASSTCGGASTMTQSSSGLANAQITSGGSGGTSEQKMGLNQKTRDSAAKKHEAKKKKAGILCDEYVHPGGGKGAHAESKIMNNLTNKAGAGGMGGCSVLVSIDWRRNTPNGGVQQSGMPCDACYAMLCHAASCGIQVKICAAADKPPAEINEENCKKLTGYQKLCQQVDGKLKPGR